MTVRLLVGMLVGTVMVVTQVGAGLQAAAEDGLTVSAHRGGAAYAPENTMVAFRNAVRLGVDQLEADTQLTADGRLVVIHDDTVERTTDCSGSVPAMTLAELQACDAAFWFSPGQPTTSPAQDIPHPLRGAGVTIPTAEELLDLVAQQAGVELSIEIKDIPGEDNFDVAGTAVAEVLVPQIQAHGIIDRVVVQSFWPPAIDAVKRLEPAMRTQLLTTSSTGQTAVQNLAYVTARGHDVMAPNHDVPDLTADVVAAAHAAGVEVVPWTPDTPDDLGAALDLGVDGIITNFPGCLLDLLGRSRPQRLLPPNVAGTLAPCRASGSTPPPNRSLPDDRPSLEECKTLRPSRWAETRGVSRPGARLRAFALQFKQDVRHVQTYDTFRTKMRCLMEEHVVPHLRPGLPALVVYNEDIGLMTLGIGSRGEPIREAAASPLRAPVGDDGPAPPGAAAALGAANVAYAPQVAAYQARFGPIDPRKQVFVAATDTFARAFSHTFSDIARDYGVWVVATNNQANYEASTDPTDIALFADPDLDDVDEVYVATSQRVTNSTFLWGPDDVDPDAPRGERNLLFVNEKVPITSLESDLIGIDEGPATGPEAKANAAGAEVAGYRLGFATSLPAFRWGYPFGQRPPDLEPCADVRVTFMPCMDALGVDVVVQAEANPGRWAYTQPGGWQPLEWMESTWRSVGEPTVGFRYNVTAHMVGNLFDVTFDGQSAITARDAAAPPRHYVGNLEFEDATDPEAYRMHVGDKTEFVVLADWVVPDDDREELREVAAALAPGSGDDLENDYLETAIWADLADPVPPAAPPPATARRSALPTTGGGLALLAVISLTGALALRRKAHL